MKRPEIIRRLGDADRAWRRGSAMELFLRSIKFICGIAVLLIGVDLISQLGAVPRLVISILSGIGLLWFLGYVFLKTIPKKISLLPVARVLEDRDHSLGSKLMNILQLEEKAKDESLPPLTRKLAEQAVTDAAVAVDGNALPSLAKSRNVGKYFRRALIPVILVMIPAFVFSKITWREILRFVDPLGDHPPFSFTVLTIVTPEDDKTRVIYHRPVSIEVEFTGHRPKELFLTVESADDPAQSATIPMFPRGDDRFFQEIDQVDTDLIVRAHTKTRRSVSEAREIAVILTPQLESAAVTVRAPEYTQIREKESKLALDRDTAPTVSVLAGSELEFSLHSNRPLSEGGMALRSSRPEVAEYVLVVSDPEEPQTVKAKMAASDSGRLVFDLRDVSGLQAGRELAANLIVTHDLPPQIDIAEPTADGFIVESYSTNVGIQSSDDYGLKFIRIHTGLNDSYGEPKVMESQLSPPQRQSLEVAHVTPRDMGAKAGDIISVFAEATDIRPEAQMARTRTLKLEVITEDQYNDYLRMETEIRDLERKYSDVHDELKALAEEQRKLAEEAKAAMESADQKARDELAAKQAELNEKLMKLAERMEETTRENPLYDVEKELQKVLDEEAQKIRDSVAENKKGMESFLDSQPSGDAMKEFGEAGKAQADRLDPAREEAEKKIAEVIEDADLMQQLLKSIGAYQELYKMQEEMASQAAAYANKPSLIHEDKLALQQMAGTERMIGEALDQIVENLRKGADAAEEAYPEAAEDARKIAEEIEQANLSNLADGAARTMLSGRGNQSHERAEHLRAEMEKLMGECSECKGGMGGEFAQRLKLMRQMMAGNTMSQMGQCKKFGFGMGQGMSAGGSGMGMAGMMGMGGPQDGNPTSLLGGESMLGQNARAESATPSKGNAQGVPNTNPGGSDTESDTADGGLKVVDRPAESVTGDAMINEYDALVDAYFRKLTSSNEQSN